MPNSKQKGKRGELELSRLCRAHGFDTRRTAQFCGNTGDASDVVGIPGIHIEVKRTEAFRLYDALDQARRDAAAEGKNSIPVVFYRKNDCRWVAVIDAEDYLEQLKEMTK